MNSFMKTAMKCPECPYDKPRNMGTHLFFVHGYSKGRISEWRMNAKAETLSRSRDLYDIFRCQFCPKTYRRQNSCRAHERTVHCVSFSTRQKCVPCPIPRCTFTTTALLDLCAHAKESHGQLGDFSIREARFENLSQFQAWRLQYEENTQTVLATESVNSNAAAGTTLRYLRCAQLEAQIRKVRNQLRQSEARASGRMVDLEESELAGDDEEGEDQEEGEEGYGSPQKGYGRGQKKEGEGEVEQDEQEVARSLEGAEEGEEAVASGPRRSPRKRRLVAAEAEYRSLEEEEEGYGSGQKGYGRRQKKAREEKEERQAGVGEGEEEEEVDVEELDDSEEAGPSTSAAAAAASTAAKKRSLPPPRLKSNYGDQEDGVEPAPRLLRASSAHLADAELGDRDEENEEEQLQTMPPVMYEAEKRMNSRHCTAHMRVLILRTGTVHVEYCGSHLGHEVIPLPTAVRPTNERSGRLVRDVKIKPSSSIAQEIEDDIERAKMRRKGRRETEHRWRTESRMRTERAQFSQLLDSYDDIGANVELYEGEDGEVYDEEDLQVEEVIEEEVVDHDEDEELVEADNQ